VIARLEEAEEEEFFNHYKNDLKRQAHALSMRGGAPCDPKA